MVWGGGMGGVLMVDPEKDSVLKRLSRLLGND
jgi:hypothetical protein